MNDQDYETLAARISDEIYDISTNFGGFIAEDFRESHRANCDAAVANTYVEGISTFAWQNAALERIERRS